MPACARQTGLDLALHPSERSAFFRLNISPRLRDNEIRKSGPQRVQVSRIFIFPNIRDFQSIRESVPCVVIIEILFLNARELGDLDPDFLGSSTPDAFDTKTASELSDRAGSVDKHVTVFHKWRNTPSQFSRFDAIENQVRITRFQRKK